MPDQEQNKLVVTEDEFNSWWRIGKQFLLMAYLAGVVTGFLAAVAILIAE